MNVIFKNLLLMITYNCFFFQFQKEMFASKVDSGMGGVGGGGVGGGAPSGE